MTICFICITPGPSTKLIYKYILGHDEDIHITFAIINDMLTYSAAVFQLMHLLGDPLARQALSEMFKRKKTRKNSDVKQSPKKVKSVKKVKHSIQDLFEQSLAFEIIYTTLNSVTQQLKNKGEGKIIKLKNSEI